MSTLPDVPNHTPEGVLLIFLVSNQKWQQEIIVRQMTEFYDGYAEAQGRQTTRSLSELRPLEWIPWNRDTEGNRADA
jgi:hypothetical protein